MGKARNFGAARLPISTTRHSIRTESRTQLLAWTQDPSAPNEHHCELIDQFQLRRTHHLEREPYFPHSSRKVAVLESLQTIRVDPLGFACHLSSLGGERSKWVANSLERLLPR